VVTAGTLITMAAGAWPAGASPADSHPSSFRQINLVSDVPGAAQLHDADLVNARAQLRLSSGHSLLADSGRKGTP